MGQILAGLGREIRVAPDGEFLTALKSIPARMSERLAFMTGEHHAIRDFVVREMPREAKPLTPLQIATSTGIGLARTTSILEELERRLFFLVRNEQGEVSWAFPVTTDRTAHRLSFSSGERLWGA